MLAPITPPPMMMISAVSAMVTPFPGVLLNASSEKLRNRCNLLLLSTKLQVYSSGSSTWKHLEYTISDAAAPGIYGQNFSRISVTRHDWRHFTFPKLPTLTLPVGIEYRVD